jgi:hypothetical protein
VVYNSRYDILAANCVYRALFFTKPTPADRTPNALWRLFTASEEDCPLAFRETELPVMVATLRAAYGLHAGEPVWEEFIRGLSAASPLFARLWESGDVAEPGRRVKVFRHAEVGELRMTSLSLSVNGMPECRIVVYTPDDEETERRTAVLRESAKTKNPVP